MNEYSQFRMILVRRIWAEQTQFSRSVMNSQNYKDYFYFVKRTVIYIVFLLIIMPNSLLAKEGDDPESEYKAYFIYTFSKYVEWEDFGADSTFIIGVIGNSNMAPYLERIADVKSIKGKKIIIQRWQQTNDIGVCHMLFIPRSQKDQLNEIRKKTEGMPILTIGDTKGFAKKGVHINLLILRDRIGFEVNMTTIDDTTLKVSSQLLKLATSVY